MSLKTIPSKREDFERLTGFEYIKSRLNPKTHMGQKYFKHIQPLNYERILEHFDDTAFVVRLIEREDKLIADVEHDLECILDVSRTIEKITNNEILDEIELFELKNFVLVAQEIRNKTQQVFSNHERVSLPDLEAVIDLLDPEHLRLPTFYIYDVYDERLSQIRKKKREILQLQKKNAKDDNLKESESIEDVVLQLTEQERSVENEVLERLSKKLWEFAPLLEEAIQKIRYLDIILAKAKLAIELELSKPILYSKAHELQNIQITGMFNPQLKDELAKRGKTYQPVDVTIKRGVTVIVGANMSGKSVVLRTVALIQYMALLGFFVPAKRAELPFLELIALVTEDFQRPLSGLSSFASEITLIDSAYRYSQNTSALILIDEPARTTNPYEGTAIVNALVECFEKTKNFVVIVTHFDDVECHTRFRVKGLKEDALKNIQSVNDINDIQELMDYQLIPDDGKTVPKEAIRVMDLLGVSKDIVSQALKLLDRHHKEHK
ncbi:DNA mismatch repair protein MutS [Fervidobacterium ngatamarikiense]|uniref:DNA mismatch repair protein MutS n=1 Tax=Fervidobacterium pennivorans TaxID=93466 RepID=A0A172T2H8_FERPE|nr:DNA mismatch repair protein MutS [Fervidobacterium pennivorans]ANE41209.1 DNA mismatch repair protein MutS [Fervidobacterium pennivorans]